MSTDLSEPDYSKIHRINLPRIVLVGENLLNQIRNICIEQNFGNALIVTGETTLKIAGQETLDLLVDGGLQANYTLISDATRETVDNVISKIKGRSRDSPPMLFWASAAGGTLT